MGVRGDAFMVLIRNTPLDPLDRGFCKHALHGRVLCGITPCWHRGQTGGLFILSILNLKLFRLQITLGLKSPTGSFGGHVQGGSLVDATFLEALQIQPPTLSAQNPPPCPHLLTTASQPDWQLGTEAGKPGSIATSCPEESLCRKRDSEAERSGRSSQQSRDGVF